MSMQWVKFGLDAATSQWQFHMDLLTMWRNELSSISMAGFVLRQTSNLAALRRVCDYYESVLRLFAFDTGFEPIVAIYDGNIRQNPSLYEFFSKDPLYLSISGAYYAARQEDIYEQFTDQFVGNFCMIWGLFMPDMAVHALAVAPKSFFDSRSNHVLSQRYDVFKQAGDFFKWASHAYSAVYKNYSPFVASPDIWRLYNPIIHAYWLTLVAHVLCLKALRAPLPTTYIKPFIETQKTLFRFNDEAVAMARLIGDGEITIDIPTSIVPPAGGIVEVDTYGLKMQIPILWATIYGFNCSTFPIMVPFRTPSENWGIDPEVGASAIVYNDFQPLNAAYLGIRVQLANPLPIKVTFSWEVSGDSTVKFYAFAKISSLLYCVKGGEAIPIPSSGTITFHVPPILNSYFGVEVDILRVPSCRASIRVYNFKVEHEDPDFDGPYPGYWG